jgi:hypothetical protein
MKKQGVYFQKELIIAAVYIAGIFLAPLYWYGQQPANETLIVIAALFLLAWAEGLIMSYYEYKADLAAGFVSFTTVYGLKGTRIFLITLLVSLLVLLILGIVVLNDRLIITALVIETVMATILLGLIGIPWIFRKKEYFRLAGESVFLLPACILLA